MACSTYSQSSAPTTMSTRVSSPCSLSKSPSASSSEKSSAASPIKRYVSKTRFRFDPYNSAAAAAAARSISEPGQVDSRSCSVPSATPVEDWSRSFGLSGELKQLVVSDQSPVLLQPTVPCPVPPYRPNFTLTPSAQPIELMTRIARPLPPPEEWVAPRHPHYVTVQFKRSQGTFCSQFALPVGEYAVVEADRGEHVGRVVSVTSEAPEGILVNSRVLRIATADERAALEQLREKETFVMGFVSGYARKFRVDMRVLDAEFQADGNKLTVFYANNGVQPDFRRLQRRVFGKFKCRIWFQDANDNKKMA